MARAFVELEPGFPHRLRFPYTFLAWLTHLPLVRHFYHQRCELETPNPKATTWVGWIEAKESNRARLIELGVRGKMIYKPDDYYGSGGVFAHCECSEDTMQHLLDFPKFCPSVFTGIAPDGYQLPCHKQKYWRLGVKEV